MFESCSDQLGSHEADEVARDVEALQRVVLLEASSDGLAHAVVDAVVTQ